MRRRLGALDNDLIDELVAGRVDRRGFLRHGSLLGLSLPMLGSDRRPPFGASTSRRRRRAPPGSQGARSASP